MVAPHTPAGWPAEVRHPAHPDFQDSATRWLLDNAPPEFRQHAVFRSHVRVLAWAVEMRIEGELEAARRAYSQARRTFADSEQPATITAVLSAYEWEGARLSATLRETRLVREALDGREWIPQL